MIAALIVPALPHVGEDIASAVFRWIHIVAGVIWIGHLYFFNFVNAELAKTYDADTKKKVVPQLMPRALYWFRWGAAWTWITGLLLLATFYWHRPNFGVGGMKGAAVALLLVVVLFVVYDQVAKALSKQPMAALWVWYAIALGFAVLLGQVEFFGASPRAIYIHVGGLLGTAMAANVWMRIWPCQKRIITAIQGGTAPDPADVGLAGLRSKHNTYMSVPLLFLMLSVHDVLIGISLPDPFQPWMLVLVLFVVGYFATDWIYKKSAKVKGF